MKCRQPWDVRKPEDGLLPILKEGENFHRDFGLLNLPCGTHTIWKYKDMGRKNFNLRRS